MSWPDRQRVTLCFRDPMRAIDRAVDHLAAKGCTRFYSMWMWPLMFVKGYCE